MSELCFYDSLPIGGTTIDVYRIAGGFSETVAETTGTDRTQSSGSRESKMDRSMN